MEFVGTLARAGLAVALVLLVTVGSAQPVETRADRYARDLQEARAAVTAKDYAAALAAYERLIRQAPYHPGFHYQVARLSAMTGQPARAVGELEKALALGHDFGEKLDDALAALGPETAAPKIAGLIQQSRRPVGASRVAFTLAQRDLTPEGIAYDPKDGAFYLGSTWKSKIVQIDATGRPRDFTTARQDGLRAVLGLRIDAARRTLWAASVPNPLNPQRDPNEEGTAAVFRYNLDTGRLTGKFELREAGVRHILNDLDVSPRGDVFVTDSLSGAIYTIKSGGTGLELLMRPGDLLQPNGIAVSSDGVALFVACTDGIYRVEIEATTARRLGQPDGICLGGFDGLYRADGGLIGVQNGLGLKRVVRVFLNPAGDTVERMAVLENRHPSLELPTTGAMAGRSFFYMANTQIYRTGEGGGLLPVEKLNDLIILRLDVDAPAAGTEYHGSEAGESAAVVGNHGSRVNQAPQGGAPAPRSSEMADIAGGAFKAGTASVSIGRFQMDKFEVTFELWTEVRSWALAHGYADLPEGRNGHNPVGANNPVTGVDWYAVAKWCNARSERDGYTPVYFADGAQRTVYRFGQVDIGNDAVKWTADGYRLPTECEWEFAARGGNRSRNTAFSGGDALGDVAWIASNSGQTTHAVGQKKPNELGLHDLSGNVYEWCWDWYGSAYPVGGASDPKGPDSDPVARRVQRGCPFYGNDMGCRLSYRSYARPGQSGPTIGFRCVRRPGV